MCYDNIIKKLPKDFVNLSNNNLFNILFIYYNMYMVLLTVLQTYIFLI